MNYGMETFSLFCTLKKKDMDWLNFSLKLPITDPTWIFLIVLLIILFAPMLLSRLRIPHIIGMILAGMIIGDHGFNILVRDSSFELFGNVGLYYIMFLAGLEMNMGDFKKNRSKAVTLGLLAFIIPIGIGIFTNTFLLKYSIVTSILLASMYASHTLVAYPIVIRYGVSSHRSVSIAVGGTAITDTLTLLVLAVIGGLFKGESNGLFWIFLVIKVIAIGGGIMFFFPRIGRCFFKRYSDNVMQFIFVLAMSFLGAGLMKIVGMEGILGAFLAGLALNRLIPHISPLMNRIEFVGNALFIPYFLIGVGMLIDLHVIFGKDEAIKVAFVMIVVALVGKWIASWLTQKIYGMSVIERNLMYGLSNAQAAATLAAVLVGYNIILPNGERLLNEDILNGTVLLILVTCMVSSFITEKAAKKIAMGEEHLEDEDSMGEERILIPLANPNNVENLVNIALMIRDDRSCKELIGLNVVCDTENISLQEKRGRQALNNAAKVAAAADVSMQMQTKVGTSITSGILHVVNEQHITDIIIGLHHKENVVDSFYGKLTNGLLQETNSQLMIVNCNLPVNTLRRILVLVPPKAEYEAGFYKWIGHLSMMGEQLSCRIRFFGQSDTLMKIQRFVKGKYENVRVEFFEMDSWNDINHIVEQLSPDYLLVIVCARRGAISYEHNFDHLSRFINENFSGRNFMIIYPDQFGNPQDITFTSGLLAYRETRSTYDVVYKWFYRFFKKI